jgi:hypothetical protein
LTEGSLAYAALSLVVLKLASAYWLYNSQAASFALYEYFGGRKRNALPLLIAAGWFGRSLLRDAPAWLRLVSQ